MTDVKTETPTVELTLAPTLDAAPVSTLVGVLLNVGFYLYLDRKEKRVQRAD